MSRLGVVVCTNRPPADCAACLRALAAQRPGLAVRLVLSGLDRAAEAAHAAAGGPGLALELLAEPRPGLSRARNRALAEADDDEVLAFVDDDAEVGPGWLAALEAAWARSGPELVCAGGPVRPRFAAPRPAWLDDRLLPALSVLDYGPRPLDLDPAVRALYGANVAFRAGPLRAVGGFSLGHGHVGGRPRFGEEDEAQRALHGAGGRIRYLPDAWVWHLIGPERLRRGAILRRRLAYGRGLGGAGRRPARGAARLGLRAAVGAPAAALRRRPDEAMVRASRAAEHAGVLLGALGARR